MENNRVEVNKRKLMIKSWQLKRKRERKKLVEEQISLLPLKVTNVHLDGVQNTQSDLLKGIVKKLFAISTFGELASECKAVHRELKTSGCFSKVDLLIEHSEEETVNDVLAVDVVVEVEELNKVTVHIDPVFSKLDEFLASVGCRLNNIFGRGESLRLETLSSPNPSQIFKSVSLKGLKLGYYQTHFDLSELGRRTTAVAEVSFLRYPLPWRSLNVLEGIGSLTAIFQVFSWLENHLKFSISLREALPVNANIPFASRCDSGYSMLTSLSHKLLIDTRDDPLLPRAGHLLRIHNILALPPGDGRFWKSELVSSNHWPVGKFSSLSLGARLSCLTGFNNELISFSSDYPLALNSMQCRGWRDRENLISQEVLQGKTLAMMIGSVKYSTSIPFLRGSQRSWLLNATRFQVFSDYGSIRIHGDQEKCHSNWTVGAGICLKFGNFCRGEFNLYQPMMEPKCFSNLRFHMGIGFEFL